MIGPLPGVRSCFSLLLRTVALPMHKSITNPATEVLLGCIPLCYIFHDLTITRFGSDSGGIEDCMANYLQTCPTLQMIQYNYC